MTTLTTADLAEQLEAALAVEEDCRAALERLQVESATAGAEPTPAERKAEAALSAASVATARLAAALQASQGRDRATERAAAAAAVAQQDIQILASLANVEKMAGKLATATEAYVSAYDLFVRAVGTAQGFINDCPRLDGDTRLPSPDKLTSVEIGRLSFGRASTPGADRLTGLDPTQVAPIATYYASYTTHFRKRLGRELAA
jgi:hypothetical protein